jgi:predicted nucleic acid-binding protein
MTEKCFLDTNVFIYAFDSGDERKHGVANHLLEDLTRTGRGATSTQVMGEFFTISTRKLQMPAAFAADVVRAFLGGYEVFAICPETVLEASRGVMRYQLNFWDAQLWASARLNGISFILTEDLQDGAVLEGVRFSNPFRPGWRPEDALIRS